MEQINEMFDKTVDVDVKRQIVEKLLNEDDLSTKTELNKPLRWSCLQSIMEYIKSHQLNISSSILNHFINTSFLYLISHDRKGREEYIKALNAISNIETQQKIAPLNPMGVK